MMRILLPAVLLILSVGVVKAQTINDGLMMPGKNYCTGFLYTHDQWSNYWEGTLKRENLNIGKVTTQSLMYYGVYGINKKVNLMVMAPYVWTKASMGTLRPMEGLQDLTLAAKYNFLNVTAGPGKLATFVAGSFSTPLTDYSVDFFPLSIGMGTTNLSGRFTANYALNNGLYFNVSPAYTWRSNVSLDRPAYFTDGKYYSTDEVEMYNVFDFIVDIGYRKGAFQADVFYTQMNTLGGGDIRRQDMPFVSNKMNASKVGALIMYYLPFPKNLAVRVTGNYTVAGRNVGQTTSLTGGLLYTLVFSKNKETAE
jgi:hypothetical protein